MARRPPNATHARVSRAWASSGQGQHYAGERWRSARKRERDPGLVSTLLARRARLLGLGLAPERRLDVPCGTGRLRATLAAGRGHLVVSLDVSAEMLRQAGGSTGPSAGPSAGVPGSPAHWTQGDVLALPFADDTFDVVVSCRLLHHLVEPTLRRAAVAELVRVSRGHVIASYWDATSWTAWRRRAPGILRRRVTDARVAVPRAEIDRDFEAQGARIIGRAYSMRFVSAQTFLLAAVGVA